MKKYSIFLQHVKLILARLALIPFLLSSLLFYYACSKDKEGPSPLLNSANNTDIGILVAPLQPNSKADEGISNMWIEKGSDSLIKIAVVATMVNPETTASTDIPLSLTVDNTLIDEFNIRQTVRLGAAYCKPLPAEALTQIVYTSTIKQGKAASDTVIFTINARKFSTLNDSFVLPVKLAKEDKNIQNAINKNYEAVYFVFNLYEKPAVSLAGPDGKKTELFALDFKANGDNTSQTLLLKAALSAPVPFETQLKIVPNKELVLEYNRENGTNYETLPEQAYHFITDTTTVSAFSLSSINDFSLDIVNARLAPGEVYLLPVQIKTKENLSAGNSNGDVLYLKFYKQNINPNNTGLTGIAIDRSNWAVTVSSTYGSETANKMLDGLNNTAWTSNNNSQKIHQVMLNMGRSQTVKGFQITPNYIWQSGNITQMNVSTSQDGKVWHFQGQYKGAPAGGSVNNPDIKTVSFLSAVNAQYFRFEIIDSCNQLYTGIAELIALQ